MTSENNVAILGADKFMPLWYTLSCTEKSSENALELANKFHESKRFASSHPDLMAKRHVSQGYPL